MSQVAQQRRRSNSNNRSQRQSMSEDQLLALNDDRRKSSSTSNTASTMDMTMNMSSSMNNNSNCMMMDGSLNQQPYHPNQYGNMDDSSGRHSMDMSYNDRSLLSEGAMYQYQHQHQTADADPASLSSTRPKRKDFSSFLRANSSVDGANDSMQELYYQPSQPLQSQQQPHQQFISTEEAHTFVSVSDCDCDCDDDGSDSISEDDDIIHSDTDSSDDEPGLIVWERNMDSIQEMPVLEEEHSESIPLEDLLEEKEQVQQLEASAPAVELVHPPPVVVAEEPPAPPAVVKQLLHPSAATEVVQATLVRPKRKTSVTTRISPRASLRGVRSSVKGQQRVKSATATAVQERMGHLMHDSSSSDNNNHEDDEAYVMTGSSSSMPLAGLALSSDRPRRKVPSRNRTSDARVSGSDDVDGDGTTPEAVAVTPTKKRPSRIRSCTTANPGAAAGGGVARRTSGSSQSRRGSLRRNKTVDERVKVAPERSTSGMMQKMLLPSRRRLSINNNNDESMVGAMSDESCSDQLAAVVADTPIVAVTRNSSKRGSLRRNRTSDERVRAAPERSASGMMQKMRLPKRHSSRIQRNRDRKLAEDSHSTNNTDSTAGMSDESPSDQLTAAQAPSRRSIRRNRTADERKTPSRTNSSSSRGLFRSSSKKRPSARPSTLLNIFGNSDLVSSEFILSRLNELELDPDIVQVELEDCLTATTDIMPLRLRQILLQEIRPWEGIHFVDELLDGLQDYKGFKKTRKRFLKAMDGVCALQVIPVQFKTKVHLTTDHDDDDHDTTKPNTTTAAMADLIKEFYKDVTVTSLFLTSRKATVELVQALTQLLERDDRDWEQVALQLTMASDDSTTTRKDRHHHEAAAFKAAMQQLHRAARIRDIDLT